MQATKVGWVGQTFALSKSNDSGGRKSRIRRSKEERKTLVESFIKKYQASNNGNFPSLNLTHKEVGGSFYTVREIVRDIIQENRVLGPAKLTAEEQYAGIFSEQYPLGSVSVELQTHPVSRDETHILPNHHQYTNEERVLDSSDHYAAKCQHWRLDRRKFLYCSNKAGQRIEDSKPIHESRVVLDGEKDVEKILEASKTKTSHIMTDVVVETFPLRPVSERIFDLDGKSGDQPVLTGNFLKEKEIENMELEAGNKNTSNSYTRSISKEPISNESKSDIQLEGSSQNGSNPLLNRINLESWEATSKKPVGPETNPLLAFFKAFATAFVKFWSE